MADVVKGVVLAFQTLANAPSPIAEAAIRIAVKQKNVREGPQNNNHGVSGGMDIHGKVVGVDDYNKAAGGADITPTLGAEWCMSFVYWCFDEVRQELNQTTNPLPRTPSVPHLFRWAKQNNKIVLQPMRGDIFILMEKDYPAHTGLIYKVDKIESTSKLDHKFFYTIEGNSTDSSSGCEAQCFQQSLRDYTSHLRQRFRHLPLRPRLSPRRVPQVPSSEPMNLVSLGTG